MTLRIYCDRRRTNGENFTVSFTKSRQMNWSLYLRKISVHFGVGVLLAVLPWPRTEMFIPA